MSDISPSLQAEVVIGNVLCRLVAFISLSRKLKPARCWRPNRIVG
jgi:hypothetical protein